MFENIVKFLKRLIKAEQTEPSSKDTAKERLHLVLMQDRANVSADFLELMKQEIIDVIKKYIDVEEELIDVRLTNEIKEDGTNGAPSLYANIPIVNIKSDIKKESSKGKMPKVNEKPQAKEKTNKEVKNDEKDDKKIENIKEEKQENIKKEEPKEKPKITKNSNSNKKPQVKKTNNNSKKKKSTKSKNSNSNVKKK